MPRLQHPLLCVSFAAITVLAGCDSTIPGILDAEIVYDPDPIRAGETVRFSARIVDSDGSRLSYAWDFDADGEVDSTDPTPTHVFPKKGEFDVNLVVRDGDDIGQSRRLITVNQRFTRARIASLSVVQMPVKETSGDEWDADSGPDLFYTVRVLGAIPSIGSSAVLADANQYALPVSLGGIPGVIEGLGVDHKVSLFDRDENADQFMGGITFDLGDSVGTYPASTRLSAGDYSFDVELEWLP